MVKVKVGENGEKKNGVDERIKYAPKNACIYKK